MDFDKKLSELDDFWDLSNLVPRKKVMHNTAKKISPADIDIEANNKDSGVQKEGSTVIKRYIDPMHYERKKIRSEAFEATDIYIPQSALLHKVTLKKKKCAFELYTDFLNTALKYKDIEGKECPYVEYYSYVPQYDQLSREQTEYYLWWRTCFNNGIYIKTDMSYVLLYVYELINLGDKQDTLIAQNTLTRLWNRYHSEFIELGSKLSAWICDFSLLHRLPPPKDISGDIIKRALSLKEFFIDIPDNSPEACARALLKYGTEYDYHKSKFATEKNIDIFDRHVFGAVATAVRFFSKDGKMLSGLVSEDSKLIRNAFEGALCVPEWKYEIEVKYCSFSRSNELRFIMGDIVKYAENKIRAFLGVKSKLSVYSIGIELQKALDSYFESALSAEIPRKPKKQEEKHEYDTLYEVPLRPLSLENAKKIENDSWETTNDLVTAFEGEDILSPIDFHEPITVPAQEEPEGELAARLGKYLSFVTAVKSNDSEKIAEISSAMDMLPETIVDTVNEIAADVIGDILIEDNGDRLEIIDCYLDLI